MILATVTCAYLRELKRQSNEHLIFALETIHECQKAVIRLRCDVIKLKLKDEHYSYDFPRLIDELNALQARAANAEGVSNGRKTM